MTFEFKKYTDPARWVSRFQRDVNRLRAWRLRPRVDARYARSPAPADRSGPRTIIADGLWDNPNHWFRLRLFLEALPDARTCRLIGILRSRADAAQRRTMEALGFRAFIYIDEHEIETVDFMEQATQLLATVRCHEDLLLLDLPADLPAYIYYDTVLKLTRHARPPLELKLWTTVLAEVLRNQAIYASLFDREDIAHVLLSHPWKSEYGTLCWTALCLGVPAYHLTGYCEGIRIRRFCSTEDYRIPVEHLAYADYAALPKAVQEKLIVDGKSYLAERTRGTSDDINIKYTYRTREGEPEPERDAARRTLGVNDDRFLAVVYAHSWFDFPHIYGMSHFTDFLDWMMFTAEHASQNTDVHWVLRPHPLEEWYGSVRLRDVLGALPPNLSICPAAADGLTVQLASDAAVTVHGTIGIEAVSQGVPTISADNNYYNDWGFTHKATSREHYAELMGDIHRLAKPTTEQRQRAMACTALKLAPAPAAAGHLRTRCDSSGPVLYEDILGFMDHGQAEMDKEIESMRHWLASKNSSYVTYSRLRCHGEA